MMTDIKAYDESRTRTNKPCSVRRHQEVGHMTSTSWAILRKIHGEIDGVIQKATAAEDSLSHDRRSEG
jgi:hypothetical protein